MTGGDLVLPAIVAIPFGAAVAMLLLGRRAGPRVGAGMVLAAAASLSLAAWVAARVAPGEALVFHADWMPSLGVGLTLRADGFGLLFALLISGIGVLIGAYALAYVGDLEGGRLGRFYAALAAFMGAMLGIALADDLILLFVFWEITSLTSFVLIGFWYEREIARQGAVTALLVTALGGLAMLAGFVLIGQATGTHRLSALATDPTVQQALRASPVFVPALLLVLAGAFTKSAQVPFHFWLPGAMVAPTPVSTYLHAATMVKAGVFLLGRMYPVFGTADAWFPILTSVGFATFWLGNYRAFREDDLKGLLAYTTVATLGAFTMMYGLGAAKLDALQVLSHATYKGALFLVAGIVEHTAHSRSLRDLGGLRRRLPITFGVAVLAGLSMAGLPPFLGFLAKEGVYAELLATPRLAAPGLRVAVVAAMVVSNALLFAVACKFVCGVFLGAPRAGTPHGSDEHRAEDHAETPGLWLPPAVLAALALVLGLLALTPVTESVAQRFASDPHGHAHVALVPTETGPLLLSLLTIALGALFYAGRATVERVQDAFAVAPSMQRVWDGAIAAITTGAEEFSTIWQNGSLRWYFSCALAFSVGLVAFGLAHGGLALGTATPGFANVTWYGVTLAGLLLANTVIVATAKTRLAAALGLTGVGFLVALIFVVYRSPDIVLTQILIETVSTIFVLLVLYFMPVFRPRVRAPRQTIWNGALSLAVGVMMFVLVVCATSFRATGNIGQDYLARSLTDAGGANAVNVIIVDFRALDTQGEISVVVAVGLCVYGLLRARRRRSA